MRQSASNEMARWLNEARTDFDKRLALIRMAKTGDEEQLARFLEDGALDHVDDELPTESGGRPLLYIAAEAGQSGAVAFLLQRNADANARSSADGCDAIHAAVQSREADAVLSLVLASGGNVHARTERRRSTALHVAAYHGRLCAVQLLVAQGADVLAMDADGRRAVDVAKECLRFFGVGGSGVCPCTNVQML